MRLVSSLPASLLLVASLAGPAAAEEATRPAFATLDNTGEASKFDVDTAMSIVDEGDGSYFRANLLGQYIAPSGVGGYASIAGAAIAFGEDENDGSALGNLQLGGLYQWKSGTTDVGFRFGLVLPTADYGDDFGGAAAYLVSTVLARPSELATITPETTWLRLGLSPTFGDRGWFVRSDLGIDIPVTDDEDADEDAWGRVNLGVGFAQNQISATFELQNAFTLGGDYDVEERFIHTAAASVRYHADGVAPFLALSSPLDDEFRGDYLLLTAGLSAWL